jgi:Ca2+-binding RTX toxin-like protein
MLPVVHSSPLLTVVPGRGRCDRKHDLEQEAYMAVTRKRRGGRIVVVLAAAVYLTGLGVVAAPPGNADWSASCNGRLADDYDGSHAKGPLIIIGTDGDDIIVGSRHDDDIQGGGGDDLICGGGGADDIHGGDGDDVIMGEHGDDTLSGDDGDDFISGGHGNDDLSGDDGVDQLMGDKGHDLLNGVDTAEEDKLDGGDGRNVCFVDAADEADDCGY